MNQDTVSPASVLVTGIGGFVAGHIAVALLRQGHAVRGTLRSHSRAGEIEAYLRAQPGCADAELSFVEADLNADAGWDEAMHGCRYVMHTASPFPLRQPRHADELVRPAREGTLRVLGAASKAGIARMVLTSSVAAVVYGQGHAPFTEADWTDPDGPLTSAYSKSKTLAEQTAWEFAREHGLELAVINPGLVMGPLLTARSGSSLDVVRKMLAGKMPGLPNLAFSMVDVRDVAAAHVHAMSVPEAAGERLIVAGRMLSVSDMADMLRKIMPQQARKIPSRKLPDWLVRVAALFDAELRGVVAELGFDCRVSHDKATRLLDWQPRDEEASLRDTVESLMQSAWCREPPVEPEPHELCATDMPPGLVHSGTPTYAGRPAICERANMNKRYAGLGLVLMLLSTLLLAACQNKEPAKPEVSPLVADGATPQLAVSSALAQIKSGDFNSLMQHVLPPPAYQQMREQWQVESRLELAAVTDAERQDFDRQMRKLAAPDAKKMLMQEIEPYLASYANKYKQQLPMLVGVLRIMAETRITRADHLSAERKSQARAVVDAIANWALDTHWGDPAKAKQAVSIVVDSARALDLKSLDAAYQLDYAQAMQRYGTAWQGVKNLLAVYGLSVDAVLDSAKLTVLEQTADTARVQVDYQILDKPLTTSVAMRRVGKRWYAAKVLDGWHKKQAELAVAASAARAASVSMPAAPATVAMP